jgi:hypothetical protein
MACALSSRLFAVGLLVLAGLLVHGQNRADAADTETRTFSVLVDGKKSGDYHLVIKQQADGTIHVSAQSEVRVTLLAIPVYTYSYQAQEVWKAGRLQNFESSGKEKGKAFAIRADLDGADIRVRANGEEHRTRADVWPTSCWQLPGAAYRNNNIVLMGCDTGRDIASRLEFVGSEKITIAGQVRTCTHYRVMKDALHDIWYDGQERVVRDEWMSSGHRTVIELVGIQR